MGYKGYKPLPEKHFDHHCVWDFLGWIPASNSEGGRSFEGGGDQGERTSEWDFPRFTDGGSARSALFPCRWSRGHSVNSALLTFSSCPNRHFS